jgi:ABC-2 type transport system permease protein
MNVEEVLFMLGFYTLSTGLVNMMSGGNALDISRRVGRGQLDHCLIQPLPLWMQLLTEGFLPVSGSAGALCGLGLLIFATVRLQIPVTPLWGLTALVFVLASLLVQVGMRYLVSLSAFTHPAGSEEISAVMGNFLSSLGYFPLAGLPLWARVALTTVLPAGCLAWLPSLILLGKSPSPTLAFLYPLLAVLLFGAGVATFQKGLKLYAKFGSSRYKAMGHRS